MIILYLIGSQDKDGALIGADKRKVCSLVHPVGSAVIVVPSYPTCAIGVHVHIPYEKHVYSSFYSLCSAPSLMNTRISPKGPLDIRSWSSTYVTFICTIIKPASQQTRHREHMQKYEHQREKVNGIDNITV
jgi:hypothetical protein